MSDTSPPVRTSVRPNSVGTPVIVAGSAAMLEVLAIARRSAAGNAKVLITGESGVGKDCIARQIHVSSPRAGGPFIAVNCAGLTETLLESELFGHVKGSFTGAYRDKRGKLQMAHGGTLFLDEVGEMSLRMQALLLRFLETGEIQSVGAHEETAHADVRVVAATNRNLPERVAAGEFREDLLYRLRVIHIHVPPLRERREDIPLLVAHLLKRSERPMEVSEDAMLLLQRYRWPGNIRELENAIERAVLLAEGPQISSSDLALGEVSTTQMSGGDANPVIKIPPTGIALEEIERQAIIEALKMSNWVQKDAAELLAISPRVMNYKIKTLGIDYAGRGRRMLVETTMA